MLVNTVTLKVETSQQYHFRVVCLLFRHSVPAVSTLCARCEFVQYKMNFDWTTVGPALTYGHLRKLATIHSQPFFWIPEILFHLSYKSHLVIITIICLKNFDPLKPYFYIVKLGFTGVYISFLISAQKHRLWYLLEPPRRGGSNGYPQSMFWADI